jgi:uncharacterized protein (TIGR02145 family)
MKVIVIVILLCISHVTFSQEYESFKDSRDGKTYKTVKIGNQTWMAENLAFKASNGCWAYNNNPNNAKIYGYLYSWEVALKSCPAGWHLPSDAEWKQLTDYHGGIWAAGGELKETGTTHWNMYTAATNESGFTALPGGVRSYDGAFNGIYIVGLWWSSIENDTDYARVWYMTNDTGAVGKDNGYKDGGESVRCVKDN